MGARAFAAAVATYVALAASLAAAQGLDGERFQPATGAEGGFALEHPAVPFHLGWGIGLFLNGADDPVVSQAADGSVAGRPVATAGTADLVASLGLFGRIELGVDLPIHVIYKGDPYVTGGTTLNANAGVGDLRFVPKVALVRTGNVERHVLLSLALPLGLPTGNDLALRGAGGLSLQPELLFAVHLDRFAILLDGGYRYRSQHPPTLAWGDEITFGGGLSYGFTDQLTGRVEVFAAKEVGAAVAGADFPVEALVGVDYAVRPFETPP